ncbi:hypothetical protein A2333_01885 [Candidatus Wolfebacteria bacterium RIFOXYB2_FULL_49_7]|uniref:Uncharacterized protein n=1 Tax=Candidatus Wolfebacteria bacterium RIFOXYB1_FULL_54_12 TaxID=1802559 RepID=A0A1F8DVH5_9BACT|nr:MAG: hypothetical protein A2372_04175 [Candidatus Wolfebacteria bacterium RIFOXYB1_FULL_54_12]OGM95270.1 MAG: hypothetical protein A2333_01885 [Candidatus Wolfebacteria bacterium RIFOXYB2_FULL_49_7]
MYPIIAAILSLFFVASPVFATISGGIDTVANEPIESSVTFTSPFGDATITDVINRLIDYGIGIAASLAAIMILWGAFQIMTSQGNPTKITMGRKTILYALGGLVIIILARGLVAIFEGLVTGLGA